VGGTILCEYCGELKFLTDDENEVLSFGKIAQKGNKEVGVVTDKYSNEGRFVLGVSPEWKSKINCTMEVFVVGGVCRSFIVATKDVHKDQIFYAHYGEEYDAEAKDFCFLHKFDSVVEENVPFNEFPK
jgi:hypothetical protein